MTDDERNLKGARDAVLRFAKDWTAWEMEMAEDAGSMRNPKMKQAHAELVARHCTEKKRAYVDGVLRYSKPPVYSEVLEGNICSVEITAKGRVHVDVNMTDKFYRFVLLKTARGWRIDGVKWKISEKDKWSDGLIGS